MVILSASALAVEAPSSPFEPEEEALPESSISSPPSGVPTDTMPAAGPQPSYTPSASSGEAETDLTEGETLTYSRATVGYVR